MSPTALKKEEKKWTIQILILVYRKHSVGSSVKGCEKISSQEDNFVKKIGLVKNCLNFDLNQECLIREWVDKISVSDQIFKACFWYLFFFINTFQLRPRKYWAGIASLSRNPILQIVLVVFSQVLWYVSDIIMISIIQSNRKTDSEKM